MNSCLRHVLVMFLLGCSTLIPVTTHGATPSGTVVINDNAASTSTSLVTLTINAKDGTTICPLFYPSICGTVYMRLSSDGGSWSEWQLAQTRVPWLLRGNQVCAQFVDGHGFAAPISCDAIQIANDLVSLSFSDGRSYFTTISDAYNNAASAQQIALKQGSLSEDLTLSLAKEVALVGGYDSDYGLVTGVTTLSGNLDLTGDVSVSVSGMEVSGTITITGGTLAAEMLTIS